MNIKKRKKINECGCIGERFDFYENDIRKLTLTLTLLHPQCNKKHFLSLHKEKFINIIFVNSSQWLQQIENKEIIVPKGMYNIINPEQIFGGKDRKKVALPAGRQEIPKEDLELMIHPSIFENVLEELNLKKPNCGLEFDINPQRKSQLLENVMKVLISSCKDSEGFGSTLLVEQTLLQLATVLLKEHPNSVKEIMKKEPQLLKYDTRIQKALNYLRDNYNKNISLKEVAEASALSVPHLIKLFKKETGMSPFKYLNQYRVNKAIEFIKNKELTLDDIAYRVGYGDVRSLYKVFIDFTKKPPSYFRSI
jgi:AraC-like DNA-binding protein